MPLIVLTGYPCSSKSTRALQLQKHFTEQVTCCQKVVLVDDGNCSDLAQTYGHSGLEKDLRASLKSRVQKHLNKDTLVILDSLNYIKGFRYELYCVAKSCQTTSCVVWCDNSLDRCLRWDEARPAERRYSVAVVTELVQRYEPPDNKNRWDSPLFITQYDDRLPFDAIEAALFRSQPPPPNLSTVAQPLQPTNFLYDLERATAETAKYILGAQKIVVVGDKMKIPDGGELALTRVLTNAELNKIKRQFITYMKMNPVSDTSRLTTMFTQYLQSCL